MISFRDHFGMFNLHDLFLLLFGHLAVRHHGHPASKRSALVIASDEPTHSDHQLVFDGLGNGDGQLGPDVLNGRVEPPDGVQLVHQRVVLQDNHLQPSQHSELFELFYALCQGQEDHRNYSEDFPLAGRGL